jgi:hypothetical protein
MRRSDHDSNCNRPGARAGRMRTGGETATTIVVDDTNAASSPVNSMMSLKESDTPKGIANHSPQDRLGSSFDRFDEVRGSGFDSFDDMGSNLQHPLRAGNAKLTRRRTRNSHSRNKSRLTVPSSQVIRSRVIRSQLIRSLRQSTSRNGASSRSTISKKSNTTNTITRTNILTAFVNSFRLLCLLVGILSAFVGSPVQGAKAIVNKKLPEKNELTNSCYFT